MFQNYSRVSEKFFKYFFRVYLEHFYQLPLKFFWHFRKISMKYFKIFFENFPLTIISKKNSRTWFLNGFFMKLLLSSFFFNVREISLKFHWSFLIFSKIFRVTKIFGIFAKSPHIFFDNFCRIFRKFLIKHLQNYAKNDFNKIFLKFSGYCL